MIRLPILVVAFYFSIASAFSQSIQDTSRYNNRKLQVDEVNFVSSYYRQSGNNAAVTGGIGSEKLTDFATTIDVHLSKEDIKDRLHTLTVELGFDTYTSASSDNVDPSTVSSASSADVRFYPTVNWLRSDDKKRSSIGATVSGSVEYDYYSIGAGVRGSKSSKDNSRQVSVQLQTFQDKVTLIYPIELRDSRPTGLKSRNTYNASISLSQIINSRFQAMLLLDLAYQTGFLSMPFHRVIYSDNTPTVEKLPNSRFKIPLGVRASYFLGDRFIFRGFYRYYWDDWDLKAHTAEVETTVKITPFISVSPFYRFYSQTATSYFAPYARTERTSSFYTSDYDLSKFESHFMGMGFRILSVDGVFGIHKLNMLEIRYGHYSRQTGLASDIVSLNMRFK